MTQTDFEFKPGFGTHQFGEGYWPGAKPDPDGVVKRLQQGTSISVFGLRRFGKSSLLAEARERLRKQGRNVIWIDLDAHDSIVKVLTTILESISSFESGAVKNFLSWLEGVEVFPPEFKANVAALVSSKVHAVAESDLEKFADTFFKQVEIQFGKRDPASRPIIIFDELTAMLHNTIKTFDTDKRDKIVAKLNTFLAMLRHWRSNDVGVTMAITGSVSMDWIHRKYGIMEATINDLVPITVEEMDSSSARELLEACLRSESPRNWSEECTDELLSFLPANFPGIIQLAYSIVMTENGSLDELRGPLRKKIKNALKDKYYRQFASRIMDYSKLDRQRIDSLLTAILNSGSSKVATSVAFEKLKISNTAENAMLSGELLHYLESDGFIEALDTDEVAFNTGLVEAWINNCNPFKTG